MSNNSRDQQLFCMANTLIKKERKSSFLKALNVLYERHLQNKTQTKGFCPNDVILVSYHNQYSLYDAIHQKHDTFGLLPLILNKLSRGTLNLVLHFIVKLGNHSKQIISPYIVTYML